MTEHKVRELRGGGRERIPGEDSFCPSLNRKEPLDWKLLDTLGKEAGHRRKAQITRFGSWSSWEPLEYILAYPVSALGT